MTALAQLSSEHRLDQRRRTGLPAAPSEPTRLMAELLLAQAKDGSLGDDARMAELLISPMLVFYISGGVALASGGVALCKSSAENAGSVHEFFLVEMIDAALDAIGFGLTWGEGDLDFANDPDKIIW
eukprot:COSAG06_NODE_18112_length_903_cov_1.615672_2_plen_126_part_01